MKSILIGSIVAISLPVISFGQIAVESTMQAETVSEVSVSAIDQLRLAEIPVSEADNATVESPRKEKILSGIVSVATQKPAEKKKPVCWPAHLSAGDLNADGHINMVDREIAEFGFELGAKTWKRGDVNCDKIIDFDDLAIMDMAVNREVACYPEKAMRGDANLDNKVDESDYAAIDKGFKYEMVCWKNGDFNKDGIIDFDDYSIIDNAFNTQLSGGDFISPAGSEA
jgi:hypothetical protein